MRHAVRRARMRGVTALEAAIAFAILGTIAVVGVPAFVHELHASKQVEATSGVQTLAEKTVAYAQDKPIAAAFPPSAPLTPASVPKGVRVVDPEGAWDHPTWKAIGFRPFADGSPHAYAFELDTSLGQARSTFRAIAHGDLDGDGTLSTFEVRGTSDASGPRVEPGMIVDAEFE